MSDTPAAVVTKMPEPDVPPTTQIAAQGERFFLLLAIFIGIFSGLAVVCFRITIELVRITLLG